VYPHMYLDWYHNFWTLLSDVTQKTREQLFKPFTTIKQLSKGAFPHYATLTDMYSPWHMMPNLFSGVGPIADMWVFGYAGIDLLAERAQPTMRLSDVDVNSFLNARPYMTKRTADAYDAFITRVWAVPSYQSSASDFQRYLRYSIAKPTPAYWLPRGSAHDQVIKPLTAALERLGVKIVREVQVTSVACTGGRVTEIGLEDTTFDPHTYTWVGKPNTARIQTVEGDLMLAVPPQTLSKLVRASGGLASRTIVASAPDVAGIVRMNVQEVPLIHLYFKEKKTGIPPEPVGLLDSDLSLSFTDISQTWEGVRGFDERTVLAVSSSDTTSLPGTGPLDDAHAMLVELAEYLPFDPGSHWKASPDIDWKRTRFDTNTDAQLFVNQVGTDEWRPAPSSAHISNLYLGADFCRNHVGMTTIESAVTSGLEAARVLVQRNGIGRPVEVEKVDTSPLVDALFVWLRYAGIPAVATASMVSRGTDMLSDCADGLKRAGSALRWLMTPT
jgi:hypothetical protein